MIDIDTSGLDPEDARLLVSGPETFDDIARWDQLYCHAVQMTLMEDDRETLDMWLGRMLRLLEYVWTRRRIIAYESKRKISECPTMTIPVAEVLSNVLEYQKAQGWITGFDSLGDPIVEWVKDVKEKR